MKNSSTRLKVLTRKALYNGLFVNEQMELVRLLEDKENIKIFEQIIQTYTERLKRLISFIETVSSKDTPPHFHLIENFESEVEENFSEYSPSKGNYLILIFLVLLIIAVIFCF